MRDYSIDYIKGLAVLLMVVVHPLMLMTNASAALSQGVLAVAGHYITQPVAGAFLYALGFAMAMKRRLIWDVVKRSSYTLFLAITFGIMISFISPGAFFYSVLFTAALLTFVVGLVCCYLKEKGSIIALAIIAIVVSLTPLIDHYFPFGNLLEGIILVPKEYLVWDTPICPYLIPGIYGSMIAITQNTGGRTLRLVPHIMLLASVIIAAFSVYAIGSIEFYAITMLLSFLYPLLSKLYKEGKVIAPTAVRCVGKKVTSIYFLHHLAMAFICLALTGASFDYNSYYAFNHGENVIPSWVIVSTILLFMIVSIIYGLTSEKGKSGFILKWEFVTGGKS